MAQQVSQYVNPVLQAIKRLGGSARPAEVYRVVAKDLGLEGSPVLEETLSTGVSRFENKIAWVRLYLVRAGYLDRSRRGRADKGIILTTGSFSSDALKEAVRDGVPPIELVDGEKLVELFESLELGLIPRTTYDVDPSFFAQFDQDI